MRSLTCSGARATGAPPDAVAVLEGLAAAQPRDLPVVWWLARVRRALDAGQTDLREAARLEEK